MPKEKKRAYSYLRMSRPEQIRGDSLRRQLSAAQKYAENKGLELVDDMRDIGVSAFRGKNATEGALAGFLKAVEEEKIPAGSYLLVENLDRLSRQAVSKALTQFLSLINAGIIITTLGDGEPREYSQETIDRDYAQLMISLVIMSKAYQESADKSARLAAAWQEKRRAAREENKRLSKIAPAWLTPTMPSGWKVVQDRAQIVERIFEESAAGLGAMTIARRLTESGVESWGKSDGWHPSTVKKILHNDAVRGLFQAHKLVNGMRVPEGEPIPDYYPRIISDELFYRARSGLISRRSGAAGRKASGFSNLFSGLARCASCGGPMHYINKGAPPKGGAYLQCDRARRGAGCNAKQLFNYQRVEEGVILKMNDEVVQSVFHFKNEQRAALESEIFRVDAERADIVRKQNKMLSLFLDANADDAIAKALEKTRTKIAELDRERKRLTDNISSQQLDLQDGDSFQTLALNKLSEINRLDNEAEIYKERARIHKLLKSAIMKVFCGITDDTKFVYAVFSNDEQACIILDSNSNCIFAAAEEIGARIRSVHFPHLQPKVIQKHEVIIAG